MSLNKSLLVACFLSICTTVFADTLSGHIVAVTDGDTVTLLTKQNEEFKIRLMGIDAPEKKQDFGMASKQSLSDLSYDKIATIDYNKRDRYGRIVGKILINSRDINLEQVKQGMAWHFKKYEGEQEVEDRSIYANAEYEAKRDKRGLWIQPNPIPPWEFRKNRKSKSGTMSGTID